MRTIGILGGLGSEATYDFLGKIIQISKDKGATKDQDHPPFLISGIPQTPDRTLAIQGKAESPLPYLVESAKRLEKADFIVMVCNTAHHWYDDLQKEIQTPILHLMEVVADYIKENHDVRKIGLLDTDGTVETKLYQNKLDKLGFKCIVPDAQNQKKVMEVIYGRGGIKDKGKTEKSRNLLVEAANHLIENGAEMIIEGCTEIPIALSKNDVDVPLIDANYVLALRAVEEAYK